MDKLGEYQDGDARSASLPQSTTDGPLAPDPRDWLAAIIEGSEDAIVSKNLNGIIQSWNAGATRLFGYTAEEVIGKSITILIPPDRLDEEPMILAQIQRGQRVGAHNERPLAEASAHPRRRRGTTMLGAGFSTRRCRMV